MMLGMDISAIVPQAGRLSLLVGPRRMNPTLLNFIAHLAEREPLRVLDGGNRFNVYTVAHAAHGRTEVLDRITISRAFTCYQVVSPPRRHAGNPCPLRRSGPAQHVLR